MIELNNKTQQDFLNREWVQRLLDAGVDMSDAKYCIYTDVRGDFIDLINKEWGPVFREEHKIVPTYTVSELLYKLHEWIYPTFNGMEYSGGLHLTKDAPFYFAYYDLKNSVGKELTEEFWAEFEHPIESLAALLIQCHTKDTGCRTPDAGDISSKE